MKKVLLVCIGLLAVLIYVWSTYNHRKAIVTTGKPIQNYSVLEITCSSGFRGSSTVLIEFNSRKYYVGIKSSQCKDFDTNKIKLFYDKEKDEVFEQSEVTIRHIVLYLVLFLGSCIWLCVRIIRNNRVNPI